MFRVVEEILGDGVRWKVHGAEAPLAQIPTGCWFRARVFNLCLFNMYVLRCGGAVGNQGTNLLAFLYRFSDMDALSRSRSAATH